MAEAESILDSSIDELLAAEDVNGLIELGAAYQAGAGVERDLFKSVECFEAAARLGSAEAEYLVGLAHVNGFGIAKDLAEGAKRLRSAAQRGSLRGKIYIANLYEMGVHYAADRDKADVWYRNVARAAEIEAEPGTDAYELAMAELGCVRYCLTLVSDDALSNKDRARYLKKAKSMGYAHRLKEARRESAVELSKQVEEPPAEAQEPSAEEPSSPAPEAEAEAPREESEASEPEPKAKTATDEEDVPLGAQWTFGSGLLAFLTATFFAAAASAAGFLAMTGVRALTAAGDAIPQLSRSPQGVYLGVVLLLGVLPASTAYRARVLTIATGLGGALAAGGWFLFDATPLLPDRLMQATVAGLGAYLLVLLFLGLLGGTRARPRSPGAPTR